jgi:hypothetical protein
MWKELSRSASKANLRVGITEKDFLMNDVAPSSLTHVPMRIILLMLVYFGRVKNVDDNARQPSQLPMMNFCVNFFLGALTFTAKVCFIRVLGATNDLIPSPQLVDHPLSLIDLNYITRDEILPAERVFLRAIEGKLDVKNTDFHSYYDLLAKDADIPMRLRALDPNPGAIPVGVEIPMSGSVPWLQRGLENVQHHLRIGTNTYQCNVHYGPFWEIHTNLQ